MNIQFQVAGILLLLVVALLMGRQKSIGLYTDSAFLRLFAAVTICVCLNLFSSTVFYHKPINLLGWEENLYRAYLLSIPFVGYLFLLYTHMEIHKKDRQVMRFALAALTPCFLEIMAVSFYPLVYWSIENQTYIKGMGVSVAYLIFLGYMLFGAIYVFCYRKQMEESAQHMIFCLVGVGVGSIVVQTFFQRHLFLSFVMCIAIVYLYVTLENPQIYIDRETMVYNAYAFTCFLDKKVSSGSKVFLATVQIEDWRFIHENYGMKYSRKILQEVVLFLSCLTERKVKVFRIREEVFGLVFEQKEDMEQAIPEIASRFKQHWDVQGTTVLLEEVIVYMEDTTLLNHGDEMADVILYFLAEAGKQGGGTHICIDETRLLKRSKMIEAEKSLKWALENKRVEVYYQPIYNIHTGRFTSVEALARIWDEKKQLIMPDLFIPIAEQTGMILELGIQLFEKVCIFLREEMQNELELKTVSVNLSMVQCMQEELSEHLLSIMQTYQIPPNLINLEITETAAILSEKVLLGNMERLSESGVSFSLDDYGTGYANISYIVSLPIHNIKLDRSMVWSYFSNEKAAIATRGAISMIKEMGLMVVAEGVENEEQFRLMQKLGVDYIQGFYFSRPLSREALMDFLRYQHVNTIHVDTLYEAGGV